MGRSHIYPILQPDEVTCGPATIKSVLEVFGKRKSLKTLIELCKTNQRNGTSTKKMIKALATYGLTSMTVKKATLKHIQSALNSKPGHERAAIVCYLYEDNEKNIPIPDSGHWAMVSGYSASAGKIILLDSYSGMKKSYNWKEFRNRWRGYELKRRMIKKADVNFRMIKKWDNQFLLVAARTVEDLPTFTTKAVEVYPCPVRAVRKTQRARRARDLDKDVFVSPRFFPIAA